MEVESGLKLDGKNESRVLEQIHTLLETVTAITSHIESQNETIIQVNKP